MKQSIKTGGGKGEGGTIKEGERWRFGKAVTARKAAADRRRRDKPQSVNEQTVLWDIFFCTTYCPCE